MLAPHFIQLLTSSRPAAIARIQGDTVSLLYGALTVICHRFYPTADMPGRPFMTRALASPISWEDH